MNIEQEQVGDTCVLRPRGPLGEEQAAALRKLAQQRMNERSRDFILDFSDVESVDSKTLETLLWLQEAATEQLGQVRLAAINDTLSKVLTATRLDGVLIAAESVTTAVESLRQ